MEVKAFILYPPICLYHSIKDQRVEEAEVGIEERQTDHVISENQLPILSQNIRDPWSAWVYVVLHNVRRASSFDFDQSYTLHVCDIPNDAISLRDFQDGQLCLLTLAMGDVFENSIFNSVSRLFMGQTGWRRRLGTVSTRQRWIHRKILIGDMIKKSVLARKALTLALLAGGGGSTTCGFTQ